MPHKRNYAAEYARRNARARAAGYKSYSQQRKAGETVWIIKANGKERVRISNGETRQQYASYLNYVKGVLHGLPNSKLGAERFEGKTFKDANGRIYPFITDKTILRQLYDDGRIDLEAFYVNVKK